MARVACGGDVYGQAANVYGQALNVYGQAVLVPFVLLPKKGRIMSAILYC